MKTELGAYLDPLADKVLIVSIYVTLGITGVIPLWIVILVVSRDFMIVGAIILSWLVGRPVEIRPHVVSKLNTGAQIVFAALVLASHGFNFDAEPVLTLVMALVAVLTLLSVGLYLAEWVRHMNSAEARKLKTRLRASGGAGSMALERQVMFWIAALAVLIAILWLLSGMLLPFVAGMALAYLLDPIAHRAERLGIGRALSALIVVTLVIVVLVVVVMAVAPVLADQFARLHRQTAGLFRLGCKRWSPIRAGPGLPRRSAGASPIPSNSVSELVTQASGYVGAFLASLWSGGRAVFSLLSLLVITPVVAFYLLLRLGTPSPRQWMAGFRCSIAPRCTASPAISTTPSRASCAARP